MVVIGIDPGRSTGFAVWNKSERKLVRVETMTIIEAMFAVLEYPAPRLVIEDARLRKWYGNKGRESLQGAGSIKRDCSVWQEFCDFHKLTVDMLPPMAGNTKWDARKFAQITGWTGRTSEHARDAAALVFGR